MPGRPVNILATEKSDRQNVEEVLYCSKNEYEKTALISLKVFSSFCTYNDYSSRTIDEVKRKDLFKKNWCFCTGATLKRELLW